MYRAREGRPASGDYQRPLLVVIQDVLHPSIPPEMPDDVVAALVQTQLAAQSPRESTVALLRPIMQLAHLHKRKPPPQPHLLAIFLHTTRRPDRAIL